MLLVLIGAGVWSWLRSRPTSVLDTDLIAVAPFDVLGADLELWREGLVDVLARNLDGAGPLRTVSPTVVIRRWRGRADPESAAELGRRSGARLAVFGQVVGTSGDSVRISASLYDVGRGATIGEADLRGSKATIDRLADSLTVRLLRDLGRTRPIGAARSGDLRIGFAAGAQGLLPGRAGVSPLELGLGAGRLSSGHRARHGLRPGVQPAGDHPRLAADGVRLALRGVHDEGGRAEPRSRPP